MRKGIIIFLISFISIGFSLLINNKNQCCDQIFQAGWPFPFYGGGGGIMGIKEDKIIISGLLSNIIFWFSVSLVAIHIIPKVYKKLK